MAGQIGKRRKPPALMVLLATVALSSAGEELATQAGLMMAAWEE